MLLLNKIKSNIQLQKIVGVFALLTVNSFTASAGGPPVPSSLSNPLALTLVTLMLALLVIIFMLGRLLTGVAEIKLEKEKKNKQSATAATTLLVALLLMGPSAMAQEAVAEHVETIGGLSMSVFYIMIGILFIEMLVILALIINIRFLIQKDKIRAVESSEKKLPTLAILWNKINKFKPVEKESEIELDHDYDGIRELDNRLPPWWLWGFYVSIMFAAVYLWRYHVAYSAPLSKEELEISIKKADAELQEYVAKKGDAVDENTVTFSTDAGDLAEGKKIFVAACVACHKADGGGLVGPNLTDDNWLHGGDAKSIFKTIKYGINAMPPWQASYSNKQIAQVTSYIRSLKGTNPPDAKAPEGEVYAEEAAADAE